MSELEINKLQRSRYWVLSFVVIAFVLAADQYLKFWVKHNMELHTEFPIIGNWFYFHFIENNGMAFGLEFGGAYGKILLSVFRIIAVTFGFWYLSKQIAKDSSKGFIICVSLILAGAIGNIIDTTFYGMWFKDINQYEGRLLYGKVVDMLYFPIVEGYYPEWVPFKGGQYFIFFSPVFNIADVAISSGVISIFVFQKKFFKQKSENEGQENPLPEQDNSIPVSEGLSEEKMQDKDIQDKEDSL